MGHQTRTTNLKNKTKQLSILTIALVLSVTSLATLTNSTAMAYPGQLDQTFNAGGSGFDNGFVNTIAQAGNDSIFIGGSFTDYNGQNSFQIIKTYLDGSVDTGFDSGAGFNDWVRAIAVQPDGKILVGGRFTTYDGLNNINRIVRLNQDGSIDGSFNVGTGFSNEVWRIIVQPDGNILVGGTFATINGFAQRSLVRLNQNGARDSSFNFITGFNSSLRSLYLLPNGKIFAGGYFTLFNGGSQNNLIKLNSDGSKDNSFDIGLGFNGAIFDIDINPFSNSVLVAGAFTQYKGLPAEKIILLDEFGNKDISFSVGVGFNDIVTKALYDNLGGVIVMGNFTEYNSRPQIKLVRLKPDGTKDGSFVIYNGFNLNPVWQIIINNYLYVGGMFTSYNGTPVGRIARLDLDLAKITNVTSPNTNTTLTKGQTATITINYDEPITVDTTNGSPTLALNLTDCKANNLNRLATFVSGSGTNTLSFTYPIQPGDITSVLDYLNQNSLTLNGATLKDVVGNDITNILPTPGQSNSLSQANIKVEDPSCNQIIPTAPNTGLNNNQSPILTTLGLLTLAILATLTIYKTRNKTYRAK